jgi:LytS/YehU family sensor histidine kinase
LIVVPMAVTAALAVHSSLHLPGNPSPFAGGADWLTALSRLYSDTGERIFTFVATVTLSAVYYFKDLRTSDKLAIAQLGLSKAQKRRLTEELRSAQASLDPDFLFATLAEVDRRFDSDPLVAQRLLDALIRYLRAALPAKDEGIGTLGQQATLARAWLEIESIRSEGRMQGVIELPGDLDPRMFAPALIVPLLGLVCGDTAGSGREAEILVKASVATGRLTVQVRGQGCESGPTAEMETTLASLRLRLGALYGSGAELSVATGASGSRTAKIVIDDPGNL